VTEVRFYHLQKSPLERALPQLLEKVLERGHKALLMAASEDRLAALDAALWTYNDRSWLPHGLAQDDHAEDQPILLSTEEQPVNGADVLVLVDGCAAARPDAFAIVLDMFDGRDEAAVAAARERWKVCKTAGLDLTYWQQTDNGGWEAKA
jgi:DNA polymerase-3 subunit chi